MIPYKFTRIYIDSIAREDEITRRVLEYFPDVPYSIVEEAETFSHQLARLSLTEGKRILWLTHFKGRFLKPCPGTATTYRCCNYLVINETTNCPIDCTYCILQGYINNPAITIYTNYQKIISELREISHLNSRRILRIGTGELTDSLALDPVTRLSERLIAEVQKLPNILLELKSKTDHINHLQEVSPEKIVLSWSVNPEEIVASDEHKATPLVRRLKAARKAAERGFLIGFHFDPIIFVLDWEELYSHLIETLGQFIPSEQIAWISLGSLRYPPQLKEIVLSRFPKTRIFSGEQISGLDGKSRYLRPLRLKMYKAIYQKLREVFGQPFVYFCMESEEMWKKVLDKTPKTNNDVDWYFAQHLSARFPQLNLPKPMKEIYQQNIRFGASEK